jgi:hypothetical protein
LRRRRKGGAVQRKKQKQKARNPTKGRPVETAALWESIKVAYGDIFLDDFHNA